MKPPRLFDASALLNLVLTRGEEALELTADGSFLDLTLYEAANSLWKLAGPCKKLSPEEAEDLLALTERLVTRGMVIAYSSLRFTEALRIATDENVTFYDSAYVEAARSTGLILVTDDRRLRQAASKYVKVTSSDAL